MNRDALWLSTAIVHIITDVILLAMPMPILIRLNLPKRQRVALVLVFALGGLYVPLSPVSPIFTNFHQILFPPQSANSGLIFSVCITSGLRVESLRQVARADDIVRKYCLRTFETIKLVPSELIRILFRRQCVGSLVVSYRMQCRNNMLLSPHPTTAGDSNIPKYILK